MALAASTHPHRRALPAGKHRAAAGQGRRTMPPYTPHPTIGGFDGYDLNHPGTGYASGGRPSARGGNGTAFSGVPGNGGGQDSKITDPIPGNLNDGGPGGTGGSIAAVMAAVAARFS
jgi:hypothetical protein